MDTRPSDTAADDAGPFLAAAVLCERALQEIDGTISIIRVVDRWMVSLAPFPGSDVQPPEDMPPMVLDFTLVVMIKTYTAGTYRLYVVAESPTKDRTPLSEAAQLTVLPGTSGGNFIAKVQFQPKQDGRYWFDVFLEDTRVTRIPLTIVYQAVTEAPGQPGNESE